MPISLIPPSLGSADVQVQNQTLRLLAVLLRRLVMGCLLAWGERGSLRQLAEVRGLLGQHGVMA